MSFAESTWEYLFYDSSDPVQWLGSNRKIKDILTGEMQYCKFDNHPFLVQTLRTSFRPGAKTVWMKGRQGGLSEAAISGGHFWCFTRPNTNLVHALPDFDLMKTFSETKLMPLYNQTPEFQAMIASGPGWVLKPAFNTIMKQFRNNSCYKMTYTKEEAQAKSQEYIGTQYDIIFIDEYGYIPENTIAKLEMCASASPLKILLYLGTPELEHSSYHDLYLMSTQNNWMVKCDACGADNQLIDFEKWETWDSHIKARAGANEHYFACEHCGAEIDRRRGSWKPLNPSGILDGYYFPQVIFPWISADEFLFQYKKLSGHQLKDFICQVLGIPYSGEDVPVQEKWLYDSLDPAYSWGDSFGSILDYGHDWMNISHYVGAQAHNNRLVLVDEGIMDDNDINEQTKRIEAYLRRTTSGFMAVLDGGYGKAQNQDLMPKFPNKVWSCEYGGTKQIISWDTARGEKSKKVNYIVNINHAMLVEEVCALFKQGFFRFPAKTPQDRERSIAMFHNIRQVKKEIKDTDRGKQVKYICGPAHKFMAILYAYLASLRGGSSGSNTVKTESTTKDMSRVTGADNIEGTGEDLWNPTDNSNVWDNLGGM